MRIAILIGRFPPGALGGAEHQAECWATRLSDRHQITVLTRQEPPARAGWESREGFRVLRLPLSRVPMVRAAFDLGRIDAAVAALDPRPDLLLCFQTFISGFAGVRQTERSGIPAVVWIRGEGEYRLDASRWQRWIAPRVWGRAASVLVQSESNRVALLAQIGRYAPRMRPRLESKLEVVPNGIDLPPRAPAVAHSDGPVLSVGRLIPEKGMDLVIDACALARAPLVLAGTGPERERLEQRARERGVTARFEGFVDRARLAELYRSCRCAVLASRHGEGLPNVVLEALAHGAPVVATPVAGVRDLIQDGVNGVLTPLNDATALADRIVRLSAEPARAQALAAEGRSTAESFAWPRVRPKLEAVLARCVS